MKQILIASATPTFVERNENLLRRAAFRILSATTAADVLQRVAAEPVDLLLLDIHLADMDGADLCRLVRQGTPVQQPAILLICHDTAEDFTQLKESGADALIARPIRPLQLLKTVGQFLPMLLIRSRRAALRVKVITRKDPVEFYCLSHNISITGMLVETEYHLEVGDLVDCQFTIPGSVDVAVDGEVVRTARTMDGAFQYGICFSNLARIFRQEIERYVAASASEESPSPLAPAA